MSKLIVVLGATGGQGRSIGVEVAEANTDDQASLERAFQGTSAIFAFTDYYDYFFQLGPEKSMARKANVDVFIKENLAGLYEKTTFVMFTIFAANLILYEIFRPIYLVIVRQKMGSILSCPPGHSVSSIGDHKVTSGIFVRGIIENPPKPGIYVKCNVEDLTMGTFLAAWGRSSGISPEPNSTAVIQISLEQYVALWGEMGEEQASQWRFFQFMKDAGINPSQVEGFKLVEGKDVLSEELRASLVPAEEGMKTMDWSSYR
ncbi:hypothetical protein BDW59DRAFT_170912 [Aspergillus cavernicola]|uniref:NmrA-like domain-containing protein n=1 Tax=Aspergillus cavernicola TaxID=176166 RepID=A0ABR4IKV0_9EURO